VRGPRPGRLVVVLGTGTDVGKTWVSAAVLRAARADGMSVAARKPAQSFEPGTGPTDAQILADASGEPVDSVCPEHRSYGVPFAPPMAAESLGLPPILNRDLLDEIVWPDPSVDLGLVEMAGGVTSPISSDSLTIEFIEGVKASDLLLVADAGLGTINAVFLTFVYLYNARHNADLVEKGRLTIVMNRFDSESELHRRNARWLREKYRIHVVVSATGDESFAPEVLQRTEPSGWRLRP
jgi:dethiobiotin synthetase